MTQPNKKDPPPRARRRRGRPPRTGPANDQPVPLHKRSASHFQRDDRQRGQDYFLEGRVRLAIDGTRARARVEGTERASYRVGLDWSRIGQRVLHAFCECPRFADRRPCKHLWATLLALAETEPEKQPSGRDRVSLRKDRAASWRDLGVVAVQNQGAKPDPAHPRGRAHHARPSRQRRARRSHPAAPLWQSQLQTVGDEIHRLSAVIEGESVPGGWTPNGRKGVASAFDIRFLINTVASASTGGLVLDIFGQRRPAAGPPDRETPDRGKPARRGAGPRGAGPRGAGPRGAGPRNAGRRNASKLKRMRVAPEELETLLLPEESAEPLAVVAALPAEAPGPKGRGRRKPPPKKQQPVQVERLRLSQALYDKVLPHLCSQEALGWWDGRRVGDPRPLVWDDGPPWHLALRLEVAGRGGARLIGGLERENGAVPLSEPVLILTDGLRGPATDGLALVVFADTVARLETRPERDQPWISLLRGNGNGEVVIPKEDLEEALTTLLELPVLPRLETPAELELAQEPTPPQPRLVLEPLSGPAWLDPPLLAELSFDYGGLVVDAGDPRGAIVDWQERKFIRRDLEWEHSALVRLLELGLRPVSLRRGGARPRAHPPRAAGGRRAAARRGLGGRGSRHDAPLGEPGVAAGRERHRLVRAFRQPRLCRRSGGAEGDPRGHLPRRSIHRPRRRHPGRCCRRRWSRPATP